MTAERLALQARDALTRGQLHTALELTERFLAVEPTDRHWGLGFLHSVLERMQAGGADVAERMARIQEELLSLPLDDAPWGQRWERARQLNARAWGVVEQVQACSNLDQLRSEIDQALDDIDRALAFDPLAWPWTDTRVRLLLAAGRQEEAFACVRRCEVFEPDWPDFEPERRSDAYRAWRETASLEEPPGRATLREVLHRVPEGMRTPVGAHLGADERLALRASRIGATEAGRAQNTAMIGLRLEAGLSPAELARMQPWDVDLSRGVLQLDGAARSLRSELVAELRHWVLYAAHNHPAVHQPVGSYHPIRHRLFFDWDSGAELSAEEVERRLAELAGRLGIVDGGDARWDRGWFESLRSVSALEEDGPLPRLPAPHERLATGWAVASVHAWMSSGEDTWILYSYEADGVGYGFAWLTPYDELHRAYGNHPREWYDDLVGSFAVRYDPAAPQRHRVVDPRFAALDGGASFLGEARGPVRGPDDRVPPSRG